MKENSNKRTVKVGLFILLAIIILGGAILTIGNLHETFTKKIVVTTIFDDVNGLQPGNNIWFSGVKVGTVKQLDFYGKSQVRVVMKIDEKAKQFIRKDAKVKISTDGLIGNKILVVYGGTQLAAEVEDGDTLGIEKLTTTEDMMNMLQQNNQNLLAITTDFKDISHKMANGEGSIGKLMNDETLFNNISSTIASLQTASANAKQMTNSVNAFTAGLNKPGTLAYDLVSDTVVFNSMRQTFFHLQEIADSASQLVAMINKASSNPNTPIGVLLNDEKTGADLKSGIKNLDNSAATLNTDLKALQYTFLLRGGIRRMNKPK